MQIIILFWYCSMIHTYTHTSPIWIQAIHTVNEPVTELLQNEKSPLWNIKSWLKPLILWNIREKFQVSKFWKSLFLLPCFVSVNHTSRTQLLGTGTLLITKVQVEDAGIYTCRAQNAEDSIDAEASLTVLGR